MTNYGFSGVPYSPTVDQRNAAALIEQIKRLAPYYTPEWRFRPDDPDPGSALFLLFSKLLEGNIRRLNQVPYKSFLTFLNRFGTTLISARPALAEVVFALSEGASEAVYIEAGRQLSATVAGDPNPVVFETSGPILVTPAKLTDLWSVSPRRDRIARLAVGAEGAGIRLDPGEDGRGLALFGPEGENLQQHLFYVRHDSLFLLRSPATIELVVKNTRNEYAVPEAVRSLSDRHAVEWEYCSEGEWLPFDRMSGHEAGLRLMKRRRAPITPVDVHGETGYWIRCRAKSLSEFSGTPGLGGVQFDMLQMKSDFLPVKPGAGIEPDRLYFNDIQVEADECQPFGDFFAQFGLFYIASRETFSKKGSDVILRFQLQYRQNRLLPDRPPQINWKPIMKRETVDKTNIPDPVTIAEVLWEYWNGNSWVRLPVAREAQQVFRVPYEGTEPRELRFVCPHDLAETAVNSEDNYWIRGRILAVDNAYSHNAVYYSPTMKQLRAEFGYDQPTIAPEQLVLENNLDVRERTREVQTGGNAFRPFVKLEGKQPALWFGFDAPPERGPISLYMSLRTRRTAERDIPHFEWEYLRRSGERSVWAPLAVADHTNGFTVSGTVQFSGPRDFALTSIFGTSRYWIRAVNRDASLDSEDRTADMPRARAIIMNSVPAVQQETLHDELPERAESYDTIEEAIRVYYLLARTPVLSEQVWADETATMTEAEARRLQESGIATEIVRDTGGEMMRCWVRYEAVDHFLLSGPEDRHYTMDRASGRLSFGNGQLGKIPPQLTEDSIRVTYTTGGGRRGNVPAGSITSIQSSIAFIDSVVNPEAAAGGCDTGTVEEAIERGPKRFTHQMRAVTAEDFVWLAREAHPNVSKVKVLTNRNVRLENEPGAMLIVVLPKSGVGDGLHFQEMKRQIERKLLTQAASSLAFPGMIQVIDPAMLEIGVQATLWVRQMEDVVPVEREAIRKLNAFLDPLTGNANGRGWEIGQIVHRSMFYSLLKSVGPVLHIPQIALQVEKVEGGERIEWNPERIREVPHGIVVPGAHRIIVEVGKS
jgi:hypothetical protein